MYNAETVMMLATTFAKLTGTHSLAQDLDYSECDIFTTFMLPPT